MNEIEELAQYMRLQSFFPIGIKNSLTLAKHIHSLGYRKVNLERLTDEEIYRAAIDCPQVNAYGHMDADIFSMCYAVAKAQLAHNQQEMEGKYAEK